MFRLTLLFVSVAGFITLRHRWFSLGFNKYSAPRHFRERHVKCLALRQSGLHALLSPTKAAGKKQNQTDKQDESKATSAYQRSTEVKTAATEQEHQYD